MLIASAVVVVLVVLFAVPSTRYALVGLVVKKDAQVAIVDSTTGAPVSGALVDAGGVVATTNAKGIATLRGLPVGPHGFTIAKTYYRTAAGTLDIPITGTAAVTGARLVATGFPLTITATDRITGATIAGAKIAISGSSATTDDHGAASIVLPITQAAQSGTVTRDGYNAQTLSIDVAKRPADVTVALTGAGTLRYLSKATGVINVMEANLDGSGARVVLTGTGKESDDSTTLLTTTDWKYSALLADRNGSQNALYLVADGKDPSPIDSSGSILTPVGWQGHVFFWQSSPLTGSGTTIRAFDADTGRKTTVATTQSTPTGANTSNSIGSVYLQTYGLVYVNEWTGTPPPGASTALVAVDAATLASKTVATFSAGQYVQLNPYAPDRVYVRVGQAGVNTASYQSYSGGSLTPASLNDDRYYSTFPTYLESPSDKATIWAEPRDGKNTIFIGDATGGSPAQIATLSDYTPYGWYGSDDRYILLTKNGSELYIAPARVPLTATNVLKVTDYHKPATTYSGYGSGYGG